MKLTNTKSRQIVDASVLIAALDVSAGKTHDRAKELVSYLWHSGFGCVSTPVLEELSRVLLTKTPNALNLKDVTAIVQEYAYWKTHRPNSDDLCAAIASTEEYGIDLDTALLLQSAKALNAQVIWSAKADESLYGTFDGIEIRRLSLESTLKKVEKIEKVA